MVSLKVHRCRWSGAYPENSLPAIAECYHEAVARAEIDLQMLYDADFLVLHDSTLHSSTTGTGSVRDVTVSQAQVLRLLFHGNVSDERPPLCSEVVAVIRDLPSPTLLELDLVQFQPMPWPRVEELARMVEPVKDRVFLNGYDWNVRRLLEVDPTLTVAYDLLPYLDWLPKGNPEEAELQLPRGAYGYLDAHPLARERHTTVSEYIADRLGSLLRLVPGAREAHLRLSTFERMLDDGVVGVAAPFHRHGLLLDVWTLNAGTPGWKERLARALAAGVDVITTDTPRDLSLAGNGEEELTTKDAESGMANWRESGPSLRELKA